MTAAWALVVACGIVLALPLAWRIRRGTFDPFEPIVLFALAWGVMFVARPASMLVDEQRSFWGVDVFPTLPRALVLAVLGAVAFLVGYELLAGRRVARVLPAPREVDVRVATVGALVTTGIALVALGIFLPLSEGFDALAVLLDGRSEEYSRLIRDTSAYPAYASLLFGPSALVLTALALRRRSRFLVVAAAASLALTLLRVVPAGDRIVLLPLLGGIFVLVYVMRGSRPRARVLLGLAVVALLGSYLAVHVRDPTDDRTLRTAVEDLRERPHTIADPLLRGEDAEMVLALSAALTVIPDELSYRYGGATIGNLLARPVPRELWPGKPLAPSAAVVQNVWPSHYPALNPAFSPLLAFYWDLGLAGVALGMALFGLLCRLLYEWFRLHRNVFAAQVVFAASLWLVVIAARNDPVDSLVLATFLAGPVVAIMIVASEGVLPARVPARLSRGTAGRSRPHGTGETR